MAATDSARAPGTARFAMPLALRIFLMCALLVLLVAGAAVAITYHQGQRIADREVDRALTTSVAVQRQFEQRRLEQLQFMTQQLAADADFVGYVGDAQTVALGLDGSIPAGGLSVRDLLVERQASFGYDLAMVLDGQATVLARTDSSEFFAEDRRDDPLIGAAHEALSPFSGYWRQGDALYQAAIVPLQQDQNLVGFLLLALAVDDAFCAQIAGVSGAQIAYTLPVAGRPAIVASSLPPATATALATALPEAAANGAAAQRLQLAMVDGGWAAQMAPTADADAPTLGSVLSLASTEQASAGYLRLLNLMLLAGAVALALGLALSYLLSKGLLRPLRRLAEATESAAAGNYRTELAVAGNDELARLGRAVDALLSSLREKNDIEGYLSSLSRALPDSAEAPAGPQRTRITAQTRNVTLLALALPEAERLRSAEWPPALSALQAQLAAAGATAAAISIERERALFAFVGDDATGAALATLARLREHAHQRALALPAAALHRGEAGLADLQLGETSVPQILGAMVTVLDRLLAQAPAGAIVLTPGIGADCRRLLGSEATGIARTAAGQPLLALRPSALAALPTPVAGRPAAAEERARDTGAPVIGATLGQRYQVLALLGSGGMGAVYKARDRELDEIVALKLLRPGVLLDAVQLERLKDELRLARKITHPNVLRTYDYVEIDGRPCISMEYVRGLTLRYLLEESGRVPLSAGLRIARQITAGLAAAHAVGVLHRDIKPENVILEANGNAKLMDFGIARPIRRSTPGQTEVGSFVGTPNYCAPEQLAGEALDARTDIYALGVLMCEMFGGHLPHVGSGTIELYLAKEQQPPTPPSTHWPEIPPALESAILRCLMRKPDDRYDSAQTLLNALTQLRA